ncbi:MAG: SRPBCC family protein [Solirubrobacterales bacterium]|nr:SRPBCC family protein [Solirubrobacterales bacterium]
MASFTFVRDVAAPPQTLFDVLTDHQGYAAFTPLRKSALEHPGEPAPNGVGAIRRLTLVGPPLREEVISFQAPTRFSYKLLSGAPLRDHVGTVELTAQGAGTRMVYAVRTTPTVPVVAPLVLGVTKLAVKSLVDGICTESERRAADAR